MHSYLPKVVYFGLLVTGYNDAVIWVRNKHNIDINYHTLRSFMIVNFGTKLKQPRKSHYKKDEQAFETFKKNFQNF